MLEYKKTKADISVQEAQAKWLEAQANKLMGVDTALVHAEIEKIGTDIANTKAQTALTEVQTEYQGIINKYESKRQSVSIEILEQDLIRTTNEALKAIIENEIAAATKKDQIEIIAKTNLGIALENELKRANIAKTKEETNAIIERVYQEWDKVDIMAGQLGLDGLRFEEEQYKNDIAAFNAQMQAAYPSIWIVTGKLSQL